MCSAEPKSGPGDDFLYRGNKWGRRMWEGGKCKGEARKGMQASSNQPSPAHTKVHEEVKASNAMTPHTKACMRCLLCLVLHFSCFVFCIFLHGRQSDAQRDVPCIHHRRVAVYNLQWGCVLEYLAVVDAARR